MKKLYWKLYRRYMRWRIRKEIGNAPTTEGKPVEWTRWKNLKEVPKSD